MARQLENQHWKVKENSVKIPVTMTSFKGKPLLLLFSLLIHNYTSLKCTINNYTSPLLNVSYKFSLKNKRENENNMHIDEKWFVLPTGKLETNVKHHN